MKTITIDDVEYTLTPKEPREEVKEETGRFVPKIGEEYWCIRTNEEDEVVIFQSTLYNDGLDKVHRLLGNMYPTKEAAEKALAQKQALQRIHEYMDKEGLWYEPDWTKCEPEHQIQGWDYEDDEPYYDCDYMDLSKHHLVFRTEEDLRKVLDNCAEDLEIVLKNY